MYRFILGLLVCLVTGSLSAQSVTLQWDPSPDEVVGYNLYRSVISGRLYVRLNSEPVTITQFTDRNIRYDIQYYYVCTAVSTSGVESGFSNEVGFSLPRPNTGPLAQLDRVGTAEDTPVTFDALANDSDAEGDEIQIDWFSQPPNGRVSLADGTFTYTPSLNFFGTDRFSYRISDSRGETASSEVVITVAPVNDFPVARTDQATTIQATPVTLNVLANDSDADGDTLELVSFTSPAYGEVRFTFDGNVEYLPNAEFLGTDRFTYKISDRQAADEGEVEVAVQASAGESDFLVFPTFFERVGDLFRDTFVGLGLVNSKRSFEQVLLSTVGPRGEELESYSLELALPPGGQTAFLTSEVADPQKSATYLKARGLAQRIQGFFMVGDYAGRRLDGIGARMELSSSHYLLDVGGNGGSEFLQIINPGAETVDLQLEWLDRFGERQLGSDHRIGPGAAFRLSMDGASEPMPAEGGYLRLQSSAPVLGFLVSASPEWMATAPLRAPKALSRLIAPHYFLDGQADASILRLLNAGDREVELTVSLTDDAIGSVVEQRYRVKAKQRLDLPLGGLYSIPGRSFTGGFVEVEVWGEPTPILGEIEYSGFGGRSRTVVPLVEEGIEDALFSQVAQASDGSIFTGLALLNPNPDPVSVSIEAYDAQGRLTKRKFLFIGGQARRIDLLRSKAFLGEDFEQVGGHLKIQSDRKIVSLVIFGDGNGEFLSAIQPQEGERD